MVLQDWSYKSISNPIYTVKQEKLSRIFLILIESISIERAYKKYEWKRSQ